jgi:hypothetical protein
MVNKIENGSMIVVAEWRGKKGCLVRIGSVPFR